MRQLTINFENIENSTIVINPTVIVTPPAVEVAVAEVAAVQPQTPIVHDYRDVLFRTEHGCVYERQKNGQIEVLFHFPPRFHEAEVADAFYRESRQIQSYLDGRADLSIRA